MEGRANLFAQLKPSAVALSEAVLTLSTPRKDIRAVEVRLEALEETIKTSTSVSQLDVRLADYIFFPIAQILKHSQQVSLRCLELSVAIVTVLILKGWRDRIEQSLGQQLLILSTLLAGESPPALGRKATSNELQANSLQALGALFSVSKENGSFHDVLVNNTNIPQLGQTLSIILDALRESDDFDVQNSAATALHAVLHVSWPDERLQSFLPGVVSTLTKVLKPQSKQRRSSMVLVSALNMLRYVLKTFFNDQAVQNPPVALEEASTRIRTALGSISKLIEHDKNAVKDALCQVHLAVLEYCFESLPNCTELALETIVTVGGQSAMFRLAVLVSSNEKLKAALQSVLFDWSASLVRIMQTSDEDKKVRRIQQIQSAYAILNEANVDRTTIDQHLDRCLVDGLSVMLHEERMTNMSMEVVAHDESLSTIAIAGNELTHMPRSEIFKQTKVATSIIELLQTICTGDEGLAFLGFQHRALLNSTGDTRIARLWLINTCVETRLTSNHDSDPYLAFDNMVRDTPLHMMSAMESAYAISLETLTDSSRSMADPRLQCLALRTLALRAHISGPDFRYELVDVLYPVLDALAASSGSTRQDSIITLNTITNACGYDSVQQLIIENVDYLTNAVALKLNSFDVSPQGPQILLMMVKLAGPGLLPYLEDTVESIFAALEDYHGYPLLVELLFKTLSAMALEGGKAPALSEPMKSIESSLLIEGGQPTKLLDLAERLRERAEIRTDQDISSEEVPEPAPQRPWTRDESGDANATSTELEKVEPPAPKTYGLLLKITNLTQHYLPSSSPSLRLALLSLVSTTIPAIAKHEDSFLPLINTLWPEIVSRLDDDELAIRSAAMDTISQLCRNAGTFMRSRIQDIWPRIRALWREVIGHNEDKTRMGHSRLLAGAANLTNMTSPDSLILDRYSDNILRSCKHAMMELLIAVVRNVPIAAEQYDDALELASLELSDLRMLEAFQAQNADAVWLYQLKSGLLPALNVGKAM